MSRCRGGSSPFACLALGRFLAFWVIRSRAVVNLGPHCRSSASKNSAVVPEMSKLAEYERLSK